MMSLLQVIVAEPFGSPELILFDSARLIGMVGAMIVAAVTPYALARHQMGWSQKIRFLSGLLLSVALVSSYWSNLGELPTSGWRTLTIVVSIVCMAIGYIAYLRQQPMMTPEPEIRNIDRMGNIPAVFIAADDLGRIITVSGQTQDIIGWEDTSLIGRPIATIIPPSYLDRHFAGMDRLARTGQSDIFGKTIEVNALTRLGNEMPVNLTVLELPKAEPNGPRRFLGIILTRSE